MTLTALKPRTIIKDTPKLERAYIQFEKLLNELQKRDLPEAIIHTINTHIEALNALPDNEKTLRTQLKKGLKKIVTLLEKELQLVPKNYYQQKWMAIGISVFGIPLGVVFGTSLGNMAFLGIGLPIGMAMGIAVGSEKDKKAQAEGRQLDLELKY
ncbi:hypothetical protein [Mangrovimonas sp. DI 80]|uniref:hypothetical protein n=1 Tax=Mangrovimonas sp. DI 80 TaxID=1779330 RepID=UPI0009781E73|nr:hypothetical protein [Mangrovimonas sp. DI 80]OMP32586.1 hypothetical protein BKM32_05960 [Mangrovimonas sp. DI 80]